jgi:hypothetical protein
LVAIDPLLVLLQRYEAERAVFDNGPVTAGMTDENWDRIAETTWVGTQARIIAEEPPATSAAAAICALDHVLQSDDLFADRCESAELQMLWLLIKTARDYLASLGTGEGSPSQSSG